MVRLVPLHHAATVGDNSAAYDNLDRVTNFRRGTLSSSSLNNGTLDTVSTAGTTNNWALDAVGNWTNTSNNGQTRTVNAQNQYTSIQGKTTPTYDHNRTQATWAGKSARMIPITIKRLLEPTQIANLSTDPSQNHRNWGIIANCKNAAGDLEDESQRIWTYKMKR